MEKTNSYIKGLDGLRAVAASIVFGYHLWGHWNYPTVGFKWLGRQFDFTWLFHYGTEGVSIFFVLSGFLLSQPFWKAALGGGRAVNVREFFWRRFLRIYPAYLIAVVIFALFFDTGDSLTLRLTYFITHLFLIHNLFELTIFRESSPLWSVATEFQMYLVLPLLFGAIGLYLKDKGRPAMAAALLFTAAGLVALVFYNAANVIVPAVSINPDIVRVGGNVLPHLPIMGMAYFGAGVAFGYVYQWIQMRRQAGISLHRLVPELIGLAAVFLLIPFAMTMPNLGVLSTVTWPRLALLYGVVVTAVALGGRTIGLTALLEWAPIRYVGMISYSFYLYHDYMLHIAFHYLPPLSPGAWLPSDVVSGLIAYGLTLVASTISYYAIEKRFHTVKRQAATATAMPTPAAMAVTRATHSDKKGKQIPRQTEP